MYYNQATHHYAKVTSVKVERAADCARMATDTMVGLDKIGHAMRMFACGLHSEAETIELLRN